MKQQHMKTEEDSLIMVVARMLAGAKSLINRDIMADRSARPHANA
jgi:hypothetical protein